MSIDVKLINKEDKWFEMNRACFGFLSYINQWGGSDVSNSNFGIDEDYDEDYDDDDDGNGIDGFESDNLKAVVYQTGVASELQDSLEKAMAGLPQFYGNVTVEKPCSFSWEFYIPLDETKCMQIPVIAGMMLRNVIAYTSSRSAYIEMVTKGIDPTVAFILAQTFFYRNNPLQKNKCGFYRNFGGDETIFKEHARICDIINTLKGGVGDAWQGPFGATDNGYGRYGTYDCDSAPRSERTSYQKDLADLMLVTDKAVWSKSPTLNRADKLGFGIQEQSDRVFIETDEFINKFVPFIMEQLK